MSRRADCWDNAPLESFFASLKFFQRASIFKLYLPNLVHMCGSEIR